MATGNALSAAFRNDIMKLIFNAVAIANIADNAAAAPLTNIYVALHTADPGAAGDQTTSEIAYTGYARVAVVRTNAGWVIVANSASPVAAITFGAMTAGVGGVVTHASVGVAASGASKILWGVTCTVTPNITVSNGVTPSLPTTSAFTIN